MQFFYIIKHTPSGLRYAGSKVGRDASPDTLMTESGYQTSSKEVKALIARDGLGSFEVEQIVLQHEINIPFGMPVADYETWFLQSNDCAKDLLWMNKHNNDGMNFASSEFKVKSARSMMLRHGVSNAMLIPEAKAKVAAALAGNKYGCKKRSPEQSAKLSALRKGLKKSEHHRASLSAAKTGLKASDAVRQKMSEMRQRGMHPRAIRVCTPLGVFDCINDAAEAHKVTSSAVRKWLKNKPDLFSKA